MTKQKNLEKVNASWKKRCVKHLHPYLTPEEKNAKEQDDSNQNLNLTILQLNFKTDEPMVYNRIFVMSKGNNHTYRKETGLVHHTDYNDQGRRSFDYNPLTGEVTRDHSVSNKNQYKKVQWPDSNLWDD